MFFLRHIVNYLSKYYRINRGAEFIDAIRMLNRPSEVIVPDNAIPEETLAQLRGLFTRHVLEANPGWVWPYWIERQRDPKSVSYIGSTGARTCINQTHRNWTPVGLPGGTREALVDPRGAITPWIDGWSLDTWIQSNDGWLFPSRLADPDIVQGLVQNLPIVWTRFRADTLSVETQAWSFRQDEADYVVNEVRVTNSGNADSSCTLAFSIRPVNAAGMSVVNDLAYNTRGFWNVEGRLAAFFPTRPTRSFASCHAGGDVANKLNDLTADSTTLCDAGLGNGISLFDLCLAPGETIIRHVLMPLEPLNPRAFPWEHFTPDLLEAEKERTIRHWNSTLAEGVTVSVPDERYQATFDASKGFLLLSNDAQQILGNPSSSHRFRFREAVSTLRALGVLGFSREVSQALACFPLRQWKNGYFCAQNGEWDSSGQPIWCIVEHFRLTRDEANLRELYPAIRKAALWIEKKRHDVSFSPGKPRGLMPAGFSTGPDDPTDYYYRDNFWSLRGLRDAAFASRALGYFQDEKVFERFSESYLRDVTEAINRDIEHSESGILPAAAGRRSNAGIEENLAAVFPRGMFTEDESSWVKGTLREIGDQLWRGEINPSFMLRFVQCMVRSGDLSWFESVDRLLEFATPTLSWPEAIHPLSRGGCAGDGHDRSAAAEWIQLVRDMIVREEADILHIAPAIPASWRNAGCRVAISSAPTYFGLVSLAINCSADAESLVIKSDWRMPPREIHWHLSASDLFIDSEAEGQIAGAIAILSPNTTKCAVSRTSKEHQPA